MRSRAVNRQPAFSRALFDCRSINTSYGKKYITFYRAKRDISVLVKLCPRRNAVINHQKVELFLSLFLVNR